MSRPAHSEEAPGDLHPWGRTGEGTSSGARWIARSTSERLVRVATEFLLDEGFEVASGPDTAVHDGDGDEWTSALLQTPDVDHTRRRWWGGFSSDQANRIAGAARRALSPTVVVAARPVVTGVAELVVFPYSREGAPHTEPTASALASALMKITAAAGVEGAMLSHEPLAQPPDEGPASPAAARDVLGRDSAR